MATNQGRSNTRFKKPAKGRDAAPKEIIVEPLKPDKPDEPMSVIAAALFGVFQSVGYIERTGQNDFHNYTYATESDFLAKVRPALIAHGLMLIPSFRSRSEIDQHGNVHAEWEYTLLHKSGVVWPEKIIAAGAGNDKAKNGSVGDKGLYKAFTGANKYLLNKLLQIATGDDPEREDRGHEGKAPRSQQGNQQQHTEGPADNQQSGDQGGQPGQEGSQGGGKGKVPIEKPKGRLTVAEEETFREHYLTAIKGARTIARLDTIMLGERAKAGLPRIRQRWRDEINEAATKRARDIGGDDVQQQDQHGQSDDGGDQLPE